MMHLIELGLGNYMARASRYVGRPALRLRVEMGHGKQIGTVEFVDSPDMDSMPGDTMITFASKKSIDGLIESLTLLSENVEDTSEEEDSDDEGCDCDVCNGCQGESSEPPEIPAHATGSDKDGDYRLIKLQSMPEKWSHLRMYQNGGMVVVLKDFTEREATVNEVLGTMIFVASGRWSYIDQPVKSEYPKYVLNNRGDWDIAFIEQTGPSEWICVGKDRTRSEMMPGESRNGKVRLFNMFIGDGSWRYVTKVEAMSRLESQS